MIRYVMLLLCLTFSLEESFALTARHNLGLFGGQVEFLAVYDMPSSPNRIYGDIRGSNALYFTDDNAASWNLAISGEDVFGIATDANYIYAIVNGNEIWRSNGNDGLTWTTILSSSSSIYSGEFFSSIQHDGTRLMVGASNGVAYFNATGNPADWTRYVVRAASSDTGIVCMASRPGLPKTILAVMNNMFQPLASSNELYESTDSGVTWTPVMLPLSITQAIEVIAEDPVNPDHVYLGGDSANATMYFNASYLDPTTWIDITPPTFMSRYPQQIAFHNGLTWTTAHTYDPSTGTWTQLPSTTSNTHVNDGTVAFDPDDPLLVFIASDVGCAVSTDGGVTFDERNDGIEGVEVFDIDVDVIDKNTAVVASKSGLAITNVFQKPPTPADWSFPVFPQGNGGPPMTAVCLLQGSTQEIVAGDNSESIFLSEDGGATWRETYAWLGSPIADRSTVKDIDHAVGSNVLYAAIGFWEGGNDGIVVRSDDRGKTWINTALTGVHANTLEVVGTNLVYVGVGNERDYPSTTNTGIYASNDSGATWTAMTFGGSTLPFIVTDIAQDPVTPTIQYVAATDYMGGGGVFQIEYDSTGMTVVSGTDLISTYGGPVGGRYTAIETNDLGTQVFVGIEQDVYIFDVPSTTWTLYHSGLRGESVYRLFWDALVSGTSTGFYSYSEETSIPYWKKFE